MPDALLLGLLLALPFAGSIVAAALPVNARNAAAGIAAFVGLGTLGLIGAAYDSVAGGGTLTASAAWLPARDLEFRLRMDGFAWLFALIVAGIGTLVALYARYYMAAQDPVPRFFAFLLAFMGSMLGVVIAGNLLQIVFFWELTSLFSFLLIGYWHHAAAPREGARMALVVTSAGGLCLLAGVLIVGQVVGSYDLDKVLASGDAIRSHDLYLPMLVLILAGALTKSAQFPFHFWLPHAMAAPTPVSAYLHSAAMVKLGVFLMTRLWPVLAGTDAWMWTAGLAGLVTFVVGAYAAIFQHDLKGLLAYSTISHLGLITTLLGLNSPLAAVAAIFHTVNHATFKASLFMGAGIIDHEAGTRDIRRLSGLARFMPITATFVAVAAGAMAGVPLLNGFLSKEMFFAEALDVDGPLPWLDRTLPYLATLAGMFSVAYSVRLIHGVFLGPPPVGLARMPQEPARWMRMPIELLVVVCVLVGIMPALTIQPLLDVAVVAVLGNDTPQYSLRLWHGFNVPFVMSLVALAGGGLLYVLLRRRLDRGDDGVPLLPPIDSRLVFDAVLLALTTRAPRALERLLGTQRLQPQLRWLVAVAIGAAAWVAWDRLSPVPPAIDSVDVPLAIAWTIGALCAVGAAWQAKFHRLAALILASGAGLVTCLTFVWYSAPDLALTQLLVEIVTSVLLLLGLRWLPKRVPFRATWAGAKSALPRRARDLALALAAGGGAGGIAYAVLARPAPSTISGFFVEHAWPQGGGTNVVNVLLVDFRAFDTLGEITVLATAAVAVYALLRRFRPPRESMDRTPMQRQQHERAAADDILVPGVIMRAMFAAIVVLGLFLLARGHNLPGGGFVAGLTIAVAIILQYMAGGTRWFEDRLRIRPVVLIGLGLAIAAATGVGSWFVSHPFLTSHVAHLTLPLLGEIHLPSAMLFDIGVFLLVVGSTGLTLIALAHQSLRAHRTGREGEW
jgi:multicomponent K+:H+ antiporter subunit A